MLKENKPETKRKQAWLLGLLVVTAILVTLPLSPSANGSGGAGDLVAHETTAAITLDGQANEAAWDDAAELASTKSGLTLKALYTDSKIYILATWDDTTENTAKKEWSFDDTASEWVQGSGNEDRLGIIWNIDDSVADFNAQGCQIVCHTAEDKMATNGATEKMDTWHWKAARSNPAGWIDDKNLDDGIAGKDGGRHGDAKTAGGYKDNKQTLNYTDDPDNSTTVPLYWEPGATGDDAKSITGSEIGTDTKEITEVYKSNGTLVDEDGNEVLTDATMPGYTTTKPTGSRGDVSVSGVWASNKWTVEISRKLDTGNDDDIQFSDLTGEYHFGLAIFDNAGGDNHQTDPNAYALTFEDTTTPTNGDDEDDPGFTLWVAAGAIAFVAIGLRRRRR